MLRPLALSCCALAIALSGCAGLKAKKPIEVRVAATAGNNVSGTMTATSVTGGVRFMGRLTGLEPGSTHGFHVHEHGDCTASDASSAGGHFNPTGGEHGDPQGMTHHAGDIPNQVADAHGGVDVDATVRGLSLGTGTSDDVLGRALVVHADPDDYTTQPSGNSGARIACGVILRKP